MKLSKFSLGFLVAAATTAFVGCQKVEAANVVTDAYVSTAYGHQWMTNHDQQQQKNETGFQQEDRGFVHAAVGTKLNNGVGVQVEYSQVKPLVSEGTSRRGIQETTAVVANIPAWTVYKNVNTYGVAGLGYTQLKAKNVGKTESAVAIVGAGAEWVANPTITLFTEGRVQYVDKGEFWQPQALLGVRVNTYQVFKNITNQ